MNYQPFKDREIEPYKPVELYRCLNRKGKVYSIRQNGLVIGHTIENKMFVMENCKFVVQQAGKNRAIREQQRNVHAFIRGFPEIYRPCRCIRYAVKYDPYSKIGFSTGFDTISEADIVHVDKGRVYAIGAKK